MESSNSPNKAIIGIIVVALLVAAATAVIVLSANNAAQENTSTSSTTSVSPSASPSTGSENSAFKDGTYTAQGNYQTPGGQESIGVTVTLSGSTITDASVEQQGKTGEAEEFQSDFASGFKAVVVGKKIDEVSLSRVAGSSLTPNGFNDAISDIQNQAKA